ncbi:unnamed protein product [Clonostachys byssicola]|uniref:Fungal N-terminal domain-containing protein n=1 Tax=Clonostachys byssicola TaxID=160290 RepID=A0A9N9U7A0_9HYPO|nr:unnamed protein product [Clonostachys byssicola]
MANPLSVAGSAVAVVSLGLRVTGGITEYIDALQSRDQYIASVRQKNDTLRKTLQVVEASLSRLQLQGDHQAAAQVVRECLDTSMKELKALEDLITELTVGDPSLPRRQSKLKTQGKKLMYPFSRPKLEQLGTRLGHINAALQLALQTLGLSISQLSTEKLVTLEAASHAMSTDLLMVQSEVSAIGNPIKDMHKTLSGFETRFESLEDLCKRLLESPAMPRSTPEATSNMITTQLISKPAVLRDMCDASGAREFYKSNQFPSIMNHGSAQTGMVSRYPGGRFSCVCRHLQHLQRNSSSWGAINVSFETITEKHLPGCPAGRMILDANRSQKINFTYTGLRKLLNSAIQLSFMMPSGAGGWSLGSNITIYPIVDSRTAPVFKLLTMVETAQGHLRDETKLTETLYPSVVSSILRLFQARKASPRAVDDENRSLVHYLIKCIRNLNLTHLEPLPSQAEPSVFLDLLQYLLANKAPANDYDDWGNTPISTMFTTYYYSAVTDPIYSAVTELILQNNTEGDVVCISGPPNPPAAATILDRSGRKYHAEPFVLLLHFLSSSTKLAEAYGCGPLSIAILSNSMEQVEYLVKNHPATLAERNLFGYTPLHLAADKPQFLRLLAKAADACVLNHSDNNSGMSPVEAALMLSRLKCRERENSSRMCRRCRCAECVVILLKADCSVPVSPRLSGTLSCASKRCSLKYIRHMKARRDRLKRLAIDNLSIAELEQLDLSAENVLDSLAPRAIHLLQKRGVSIPEALEVGPLPVYRNLQNFEYAELFFRVDFHDTDAWIDVDKASLESIPPQLTSFSTQGPSYLLWLGAHGAESCQFKSFDSPKNIFTALFLFFGIGPKLENVFSSSWNLPLGALPLSLEARKDWFRTVNSSVLSADIHDECRCLCSPTGCTPVTSLLKGAFAPMIWKRRFRNLGRGHGEESMRRPLISRMINPFIHYLEEFWAYFEVRHHTEALRYLTFELLGISHCCCQATDPVCDSPDEIEEKHGYELALLEELMHEFSGKLTKVLKDPSLSIDHITKFWTHTWVDRMTEVLDKLEGDNLTVDEKREAEEIGVVWKTLGPEPPESPTPEILDNPYDKSTIDHWMYEVYKIEAAC